MKTFLKTHIIVKYLINRIPFDRYDYYFIYFRLEHIININMTNNIFNCESPRAKTTNNANVFSHSFFLKYL